MGQYYLAALRGKDAKRWKCFRPSYVNESARLTVHAFVDNPFVKGIVGMLHKRPYRVIWEGDYDEEVTELKPTNLFEDKKFESCSSHLSMMRDQTGYPIIYNVTKNEFVDVRKCFTGTHTYVLKVFHPLPMLCAASSNGYGGGDYMYKADYELVGKWRYDFIRAYTERGFARVKNKYNPTELLPNFGEQEGTLKNS